VRRKSRYTFVKAKSATFSDKIQVVKKKVVQVGVLSKKHFHRSQGHHNKVFSTLFSIVETS